MKKSLIYILAVAAGLFSCDPYKDLNKSVQQDLSDQRDDQAIPESIIISEDDTVFATVASAQEGIPVILKDQYSANQHTDGRLVEVTYSVGTLVDEPTFNAPHFVSNDEYKANEGEVCYETKLWSEITLDASLTAITFTTEDYALTGDDSYNNFGYYDNKEGDFMGAPVDNILDAKINYILQTNYASESVVANQVTVTYKYYDNGTNDVSRSFEYNESNNCYYGFKSEDAAASAMPSILASAYADEATGFVITTSYKVFESYEDGMKEEDISLTTVHKTFEKEEDGFELYEGTPAMYMLYDEDYDRMGSPGKYNNFSSSDAPENYLPQFAALILPYAQVDDEIQFLFKYYAGGDLGTIIKSMTYTKAEAWNQTAPIHNTQGMDKFKYTHSVEGEGLWKVSLAVAITLTEADYTLTGDDKYMNFGWGDEPGEYPEGTQVENVNDAKIIHILTENYKELAIADQEVSVSYKFYDGAHSIQTRSFVYDASSSTWVRQ
ncbi:hypothetical protein [Flammeovirga aprica]|uniref:DUF5017 domain-containing protein n=1 Tax=Flammeovirga aprica JL-4 TaxID=694437 RepID=A0A7X9XAT4_9BACT|nr:hypothetical protein [Flammeovirga aprica]NME69944.1 hypothetical protein [Flammeovirga aprica JL-4]